MCVERRSDEDDIRLITFAKILLILKLILDILFEEYYVPVECYSRWLDAKQQLFWQQFQLDTIFAAGPG